MENKFKKTKKVSVLVCCVSLLMAGLTNTGAAAEEGSILERAMKTTNPELGELIRKALANSPELENDQAAKATLAKRVTEAYLLIKTLDAQINEAEEKIESPLTTKAIRTELIIVKRELETKRITALAELRETMKLVPEAEYERPVKDLDTWLVLDVIGVGAASYVCVYEYSEPFFERDNGGSTKSECRPVEVKSPQEALAYVRTLIESKESHPLRLEIFRNQAGHEASEELKKQIDQMVEDAKLDMNPVEVYLDKGGYGRGDFWYQKLTLKQGKSYWMREKEPREQQAMLNVVRHHLSQPRRCPFIMHIEFDRESRDLAQRYVPDIRKIAKELGVQQFVDITLLSGSFGQRKPVERLNSWLVLDAIAGDSVRVIKGRKPYRESLKWNQCDPVGVISQQEAIAYVENFIKIKEHFPLRIDIYRNEPGSKLSEGLYKKIEQILMNAKLEEKTEVYLDGDISPRTRGVDDWIVKQGKLYIRTDPSQRATKPDTLLQVNIDGMKAPKRIPWEYLIEYDQEGKDFATKAEEALLKAARELGVKQFVDITLLCGSFGQRKPVEKLNSWLALDVIEGDVVCVYKYRKPYDLMRRGSHTANYPLKLMSRTEAITFVKNVIGTKEDLPLRVDVLRNEAGRKPSEELYKQIVQMVKDANLETTAEVNLYADTGRADGGDWLFVLKEGKAYLELVGIEESDAEGKLTRIRNCIGRPRWLPFKIDIEFDHESKDLAEDIIEGGQKIAKELGVEQFVEIKKKESKP